MTDSPANLREVLDSAARAVGCSADAKDPTAWSREGRVFAAIAADGSVAEFRLDAAVAAAARRTPDTAGSDRGPEWVRFAPRELDGHAVDRATAWFEAAYRRAG